MPDTSSTEMQRFSMLKNLKFFTAENGYIRICSGVYYTPEMAMENQKKLRVQGFADAFVTPYYKGKRISTKEATTLKK